MKNPDRIAVDLLREEALVLFEFLARTSKDTTKNVTHKAEEIVLWDIEAQLERRLVEPLQPDYEAILEAARAIVAGDPQRGGPNSRG